MTTPENLTFIIEEDEDGGFISYCPQLKGIYGQGNSKDEALKSIKEALETALKYYEEKGIQAPFRNCYVINIDKINSAIL
jgi:predicted RNase H-like HicB family nuclease